MNKRALLSLLLTLMALPVSAMTLHDALRRAVAHDPAVAVSQADFDAARERRAQELSQLRPSLSATAQGSFTSSNSRFAFGEAQDNFPAWSAYLQARQALLRFDWSARTDRADAFASVAQADLRSRQVDFVARVCTRFLDALLAQDYEKQAGIEAQAVRKSLEDTDKRYQAELVPGTDLREAQARDDLAQAQLIAAKAAWSDAADALAEVTGYDRSYLPELKEELQYPPVVPSDIEGWQQLNRDNSSVLEQARLALAVARTDLKSRRAEALPRADLVAEVGRYDSTEYELGQRQDEASIGVELTVPIYAGGYNRSRVRAAEAAVRKAEAELERISFESERQLRDAYRAIETARSEQHAYDQSLTSAGISLIAIEAGYDAGTRTIADVLDAKGRVAMATRNRNAARYKTLMSLLTLNAIAGTLTLELIQTTDVLFVGH